MAELQPREIIYSVQTGTTKILLQRLSPILVIYYVLALLILLYVCCCFDDTCLGIYT